MKGLSKGRYDETFAGEDGFTLVLLKNLLYRLDFKIFSTFSYCKLTGPLFTGPKKP